MTHTILLVGLAPERLQIVFNSFRDRIERFEMQIDVVSSVMEALSCVGNASYDLMVLEINNGAQTAAHCVLCDMFRRCAKPRCENSILLVGDETDSARQRVQLRALRGHDYLHSSATTRLAAAVWRLLNMQPEAQRISVMVVDDQVAEDVAELIQGMDGFVSSAVSAPHQAIDLYTHAHHDIVLMDIVLGFGRISGFDLAQSLLAIRPTAVVAMSKKLISDYAVLLGHGGFVGVLAKPFDFRALQTVLHNTVARLALMRPGVNPGCPVCVNSGPRQNPGLASPSPAAAPGISVFAAR